MAGLDEDDDAGLEDALEGAACAVPRSSTESIVSPGRVWCAAVAMMAAATDALEVFAMRGSVSGIRRARQFRDVLEILGEQSRADELNELVRARLRATR
ncbi:hypothetical protein [Actinomadura harenae]|uniref:Uncharacterized protein n=1 Tax=Actinomadura harenae TaxID=2483351 RepID=A0A3M2MBY3_9ACTN|nr:hypothetical protein [Actinomadura harenae]RMI46135.1 hypothetical protein EBO15_07895 [Actinomadura harenae]